MFDISKSSYVENYESKEKPILIKNYAKHWNAFNTWNFDFFKKKYGDVIVECSHKNDFFELKLSEYIDYITLLPEEQREIPHLYVNWNFKKKHPELSDYYEEPEFITNYFNKPEFNSHVKNKYSWIYIGPTGSGSPMHLDIDMTHGWNALLEGTKEWIFIPPWENKLLNISKEEIFKINFFDEEILKKEFYKELEYYKVTQKTGDLIVIPKGWWHQVRNVDNTIAVTENYVNETNIKDFFGVL